MKFNWLVLIIGLCSVASPVLSQSKNEGTLSGKIVDSMLNENLQGATIEVLQKKDSATVVSGLSAQDGRFNISVPFGEFLYKVSFLGYNDVYGEIVVSTKTTNADVGNVYLFQKAKILEDVLVVAAPVLIKGDTTEFMASNFKTIPNASAEDLLKKLPGMEVEKDGSIKAQGEPVTRILVDGKLFFGNDPKLATKNIPTDIIDRIQVIDAQSEQSQFSGFDDGERVKTINIVTKKDKRKGVFGKGNVAVGNKDLYTGSVNVNRFNNERQISFIGQANNINSQGFSQQDFLGSLGTGTNGLSKTMAAGVNYNDVWDKNTRASGSYFYNRVNAKNVRERYRETFVTNDSSLFNNNQYLSDNNNFNHRFNFEIEHRFDSSNSIIIKPNFNYQETDNESQTTSSTSRGKLVALNTVQSTVNTSNYGINFDNSILFRHRFKKPRRTFSIDFTQELNTNKRLRNNLSIANSYNGNIDTINQRSNTDRDGKNIGANLSYTEPIGSKSQFEINYKYNRSENTSDQRTFSFDKATGNYTSPVTNLSNKFENLNISQHVGFSYRVQPRRELNYSFGLGVQFSDLQSNNLTKTTLLKQSFTNLFPSFNIQYKKGRKMNLRFAYRGRTSQPSVIQLQDVVDNSNVLRIRSGNPALKQEFNNDFRIRYTNYNAPKATTLSVIVNARFIVNDIANTSIINTTSDTMLVNEYKLVPGAEFIKPQNINGAYNIGSSFNYSFPLRSIKSTLHLGTNLSYNRNINVINDLKGTINNYSVGQKIRLTMNVKERFDMNFSSNSTFNFVRYSQQADRNGDFYTQSFSVEPTYSSKSGWIISSDFDYVFNRGQSSGYNQSVPLLNAGIAKLLFKQKQGELRFTVFDLLNKNQNINRVVEENYVEDVRTQVLNRFFMLSFTYHLRKFGGSTKGDSKGKRDGKM